MDVGQTNRPNVPSAQPVVRAEPPAQREAVTTELPSAATVTSATETSPTRVEISRSARSLQALDDPAAAALQRETTRDEETDTLVYRVTDQKTGRVVQQIPDESLLRLRAYIAELGRKASTDAEAQGIERTA